MVLAAGLGTRLRPLTNLVAKPAIPVGPQTLIEWILMHLVSHGVDEVVLNLHHLPETIRRAVRDGRHLGVRVAYTEEATILGTGGGLANAARHFAGERDLLMVNGDSLCDFDLRAAVAFHRDKRALATMLLMPARPGFSAVEVKDGLVKRIAGRPESGASGDAYMFTGVHVISGRLLDHLPPGPSEINREIYPSLIATGERIAGCVASGSWYELGDPGSYLRNARHFLGLRGALTGGNVLGTGAAIEDGARVTDSILWDGVQVVDGARVERCIITSGVRVSGGLHKDQIIMDDRVLTL